MKNTDSNSSDLTKFLLTVMLIVFVLGANHIATRSHPQEVFVDEDSIITIGGKIIGFQSLTSDTSTVLIGNQVQTVNKNDRIQINSNNYLTLTGNQISANGNNYYSGILSVPSKLSHVILFQQPPVEFPINMKTTLNINENIIIIKSLGNNIFNIQTSNSNYNIKIEDGKSTYITDSENFGFYKLERNDEKFTAYLIGIYSDDLKVTIEA